MFDILMTIMKAFARLVSLGNWSQNYPAQDAAAKRRRDNEASEPPAAKRDKPNRPPITPEATDSVDKAADAFTTFVLYAKFIVSSIMIVVVLGYFYAIFSGALKY